MCCGTDRLSREIPSEAVCALSALGAVREGNIRSMTSVDEGVVTEKERVSVSIRVSIGEGKASKV